MTETPPTPASRRRRTLTVIILIGLIIFGILVGALSMKRGGPYVTPPTRRPTPTGEVFTAGAARG